MMAWNPPGLCKTPKSRTGFFPGNFDSFGDWTALGDFIRRVIASERCCVDALLAAAAG